MSRDGRRFLHAVSILSLLGLCLLTGGSQSPFRFAYFPLIVLVTLRAGSALSLRVGFGFSIAFIFLVLFDHPPMRQPFDLMAEVFSFFLVTVAASFVVRILERERERSENATATFHSLSDDLKHETLRLQETLGALSKANKQLQEADRAKNHFLANVSHELRTPLSSIRSYSEILLSYDDIDGDTRREFVRIINQESEHMTVLVNENLDFVRIEAGKLDLSLTEVAPSDLLAAGAEVVIPLANDKNLPVVIEVSPDVPAVRGDLQQLTQVLVNLLSNAVKFTSEGKITVGANRKGEHVEFFVKDTGEGIFPEEKEVIFKEYYRISGTVPDRPRGSGLGLTIAKKIVERHDGKIWADGAPGKGSTFYFTIPAAAAEAQAGAGEPKAAPPRQREYGPILIISGNIAVRQVLRKRFEQLGYQTMGADTLGRGLDVAAAVGPGLIISDVAERGGDFLRLASWAESAGVQLLFTTFYLNSVSGDISLAANGYVEKPFDRSRIISMLERSPRNRGRFFIVSPVQEEARHLQVLLGTGEITVTIYADEGEAVSAGRTSSPAGIILGSFPSRRLDEVITAVKRDPQLKRTALYIVLPGQGKATQVTMESGGEGLGPLVMMVERAYADLWGTIHPTESVLNANYSATDTQGQGF